MANYFSGPNDAAALRDYLNQLANTYSKPLYTGPNDLGTLRDYLNQLAIQVNIPTFSGPNEAAAMRDYLNRVAIFGSNKTYLGQFATRAQVPNSWTAGAKQLQGRSAHIARSSVTQVRLGFTNWCLAGGTSDVANYQEKVIPGTSTMNAAIEYPNGVYTRVTFSGSATLSMDGAAAVTAISDAASVSIPAGATFWVRTFFTNPNAVPYIAGGSSENAPGVQNAALGDLLTVASSGLTDNTMGGAYGTNTPGNRCDAALILSNITAPSCYVIGDSRTNGCADTADATGDIGNLARGVGGTFGYSKIGAGGYRVAQFLASHTNMVALAPYFSHVLFELGVNDAIVAGTGGATLLAQMQTAWGYFSGNVICQQTLEPESTSTDSWATTGNQTTVANNGNRTAVNDLLRASPAGLSVLFEVADAVETARNSGIWKAPGYTADGVHETKTGYLAAATGVNTNLITR